MKNSETGIKRIEKGLEREEGRLKGEVKKEEKAIAWFVRSHTFRLLAAIFVFAILVTGIVYISNNQQRVYIEKSEVSAPIISLSPQSPGILDRVFVKEGDAISSGMIVAEVGGNSIKSKVDGIAISVQNTPGQEVSAQTPIVQMIDLQELRVIGHIAEDKGFSDIRVGQMVLFTVDAFGSKKYSGVVDSISPSSRQQDIVFSISSQRAVKEFNIRAKFDVGAYPELKNGMSARMWVYK